MVLDLPAPAARHVQVLRMQPGQALELFNGQGGAYVAHITEMGRKQVQVQVGAAVAEERELATPIHIAISLPANERMDWLVEKATELGVSSIQPLMSARSVLRLATQAGDARAEKKRQHWLATAQSAAEQCGRNRLPDIAPVAELGTWLRTVVSADDGVAGFVLQAPALAAQADAVEPESLPLLQAVPMGQPSRFLIGPEGGWSAEELAAAQAAGLTACHLGARVLRAETAPLYILAALAAREVAA